MKTNCDVIRDLIPLYVDRTASEESIRLVDEHCTECNDCRKTIEMCQADIEVNSNNKEKMEKVHQYKKAVPLLTNCIKLYWTLDIEGRNELLKDLLIKVEYEKNEGGRWNKEAIDKFALTPYIKLITKNKSLI